jgi:integrase/recombinase XerD
MDIYAAVTERIIEQMDVYSLSRVLGHSSVEVTEQAYRDITEHDLKKQYGRFSPIEGIYTKHRR